MVEAGTGTNICVFLDRDGVLNRPVLADGRAYAPRTLDLFEILPGVPEAVAELKTAGFLVIVVTNQKDLANGLMSAKMLDEMHRQLWLAVPIDDIVVCSCIDECWCYKPNPGMLFESAKKWDIQLASSYIVGDTWRDVGAGRAAGCTTILIDSWKYDEQYKVVPDHTAANLPDAAVLITRLAAALQQ